MFGNAITIIKWNKQIHAEKIACLGLALDDLTRAFKRGGIDGLALLLSKKGNNGRPRVTNRTEILK